jgi:alginate O-acetyltransferase complex protein AlgI
MLFNSLYFVIFVLVVLVGHHVVLRPFGARKTFLLLASWLFYATWSPQFLALLIATTWVDFHLARAIYRRRWEGDGVERPDGARRARSLLVASLVLNLGLLAFFKYGRFLWTSAAALAPLGPPPGFLAVLVPLGISFYTFHSISYVIDTYRGLRPPTGSFRDFALYVAFFPQLVAGPITRWGFFGPQLVRPPAVGWDDVERSLMYLARGYVKKVVFADSLGAFVDTVYDGALDTGPVEGWVVLYAYAFQIYFDFSGYTDIAWGVAGLLGFRLPENFRHPYLAESPADFWRRWHISLSTWLRDYLYVALGGNRRGRARTYVNLLLTMVLGGLWHGAAWTFVLWGAFHGVWLAVHRLVTELFPGPPRTPRWLRSVVTFHLVCLGWVLFRAPDLATARAIVAALWSGRPIHDPFPVGAALLVAIGFVTHVLSRRVDAERAWLRSPAVVQGAAYALVVVALGLFGAQTARFIYFQF